MSEQKTVVLTADQLQEMLVTMAREMRKPTEPTEAQKAQMESDRQLREDMARDQLEIMRQRKNLQLACPHTRPNGTSFCVYVYPNGASAGYLICQQCQGMIHPEPRPTGPLARETESHIYDTALFNQHYTKSQQSLTTF